MSALNVYSNFIDIASIIFTTNKFLPFYTYYFIFQSLYLFLQIQKLKYS